MIRNRFCLQLNRYCHFSFAPAKRDFRLKYKVEFQCSLVCFKNVECLNWQSECRFFSNSYPQRTLVGETKELIDYDIYELCKGNKDLKTQLESIKFEVDKARQSGLMVPSQLDANDWLELLNYETRNRRLKYLLYLFKKRKIEQQHTKKKEEKRARRTEELNKQPEKTNNGHLQYQLGKNCILQRITSAHMDLEANRRLMYAKLFSQPIIFDCSYEEHMTYRELQSCAKQLLNAFASNRSHEEPFHLQICNARKDNPVTCRLRKLLNIDDSDRDWYPFETTEESYLDLYPNEKLVYLTPHCREELVKYNHDDIYIIGAFINKAECKPLSLVKAGKEGIRVAKLPLNRYVLMKQGQKPLSLVTMIEIMLEMRHHNDWNVAFKKLPPRFVGKDETPIDLSKRDKEVRWGSDKVSIYNDMFTA